MPNHTPEAVIVELATMRKKILKKGKGNNCLPDDFAKIHYRGYIAKTGKIVEDTYTKLKGGPNAKLFIVGHFDKIKCFDLILPQMKQGEKSEVYCPANLVYGDRETYSQFGSDIIPVDSDIMYTIQVLACKPSLKPGRIIMAP